MASYGSCHCGGYRFALQQADAAEQTCACRCRACTKLGAQWRVVGTDAVRVVHDEGQLVEHRSSSMVHKFCSVCGTTVLGSHLEGQNSGQQQQQQTLVNLRALRGFNPFAPAGAEPSESTALDAQTETWPSTGSCLCGKVTATLLAPLQDMSLREDNCSICTRNAWIGAYPPRAQVALCGTENTQDYRFGRRFMGHPFCRTCGVHVHMAVYGPPQHVIDRLPEERKAMVRRNLDVAPVNVRVLDVPGSEHGLAVGRLCVQRTDEGQDGYEW